MRIEPESPAPAKTLPPSRWLALSLAGFLVALTAACGGGGGRRAGATAVQVAPQILAAPAAQSVTAGDSAFFRVVATGTAPLTYQWQKDGTPIPGATADWLYLSSAQAADVGDYTVIVTNAVSSITSAPASLTVSPVIVPPGITTYPANMMVTVGDPASFTVVATGSAPLHYQWKKNGTDVGTDASTYNLGSAQFADADSYTVSISNPAGSITSNPATLFVTAAPVAPQITTAPTSQRVLLGSSATFFVVAAGTAPLHYQWQKDGINVGGDANWLVLPHVQAGDGGSYTVTVTNGTPPDAASTAATLTVDPLGNIDLPGGISLELVSIPAGSFTMGQAGLATPVHTVTLSAFTMAKFETTQAQWVALMGSNPSGFQSPEDLRRPVELVSWNDITQADGFLDRLNAATAATRPAGLVFRLPTEAEWEYACRGGTTTEYSWGNGLIGNYTWNRGNSGNTAHAVGGKLPNPWGLYDMSGNVWEWCQDWYGAYSGDPGTDPAGPSTGSIRVFRGGCWDNLDASCRSANRNNSDPTRRDARIGFRVVLAVPRMP